MGFVTYTRVISIDIHGYVLQKKHSQTKAAMENRRIGWQCGRKELEYYAWCPLSIGGEEWNSKTSWHPKLRKRRHTMEWWVHSVEKRLFLKECRFPLFCERIQSRSAVRYHDWFVQHDVLSFKPLPSVINTSFQLQLRNANGESSFHMVNTRTVDMAFSGEQNLAVASNCIKGGFVSIIKGSSLLRDDDLITPFFNVRLSSPTQISYTVLLIGKLHV